MQNKTAIWLFTILLTVACLYQLSFGWVVNSVEKDAKEHAELRQLQVQDSLMRLDPAQYVYNVGKKSIVFGNSETAEIDSAGLSDLQGFFEQQYLINVAGKSVYPIFGHTYQYCKNHQLNLGLDLQGGMAVTLEVSVPDLVKNLAGPQAEVQSVFMDPFNAAMKEHSETNVNFIDLFEKNWNAIDKEQKMTRFFSVGSKDKFDDDLTNEQVIAVLKEEAYKALDKTEEVIMTRINKFGVSQPAVSKQPASGRIHLELPGVKDVERARNLIQKTAKLEFWETPEIDENFAGSIRLIKSYLLDKERKELGNKVMELDSTYDLIPRDTVYQKDSMGNLVLDTAGLRMVDSVTMDSIPRAYTKAEKDSIIDASLAGDNPWDRKIRNTGQVTRGIIGDVRLVDTAYVNSIINDPKVRTSLPAYVEFMWSYKENEAEDDEEKRIDLYIIQKESDGKARLTGADIAEASYSVDMERGSGWQINMNMTNEGADEWGVWTEERIGEPIAIVLDNLVYSAPNIQQKITGGNSRITGRFTFEEVKDVVTVLEGGSLDAPAKIIDESKIGPTLGQENIDSGLLSFVIAIILVLVYMMFYYKKAGAVADVALVANIFFIIGTLASLGAALTLPGIAGIVLTIGMSVDANVLIYERIREEVRAGKGKRLAITDGYKHAYSAIIDANLTTLFTAIVLAYFGSGPIQGFAITLIIGIFTSLFSAIFITRLIFTYMLERKKEISFSTRLTEKVFANANYQFIKKRKIFYIISALIVAGGVGSLVTKGLDVGVEFSGGRKYHIKVQNTVKQDDLKKALTVAFDNMPPEVKSRGNEYQYEVTTKYKYTDKSLDGNKMVDAAVLKGMNSLGFVFADDETSNDRAVANAKDDGMADVKGTYRIQEFRQVDATITETLIKSSFIAIILSLIVIFAYIAFRFRKWQYGLGALLAMFHDVIVVLSIFSICWGAMPFTMEIDQAFIAAILTVVGYSINDTVVVFDRIRERLGVHRKQDHKEVINGALNSTLSRTINTSLSTFIVLLVIFLFADSIKGFTFALMIGVVVGTYSSLCIATPTVVDLSRNFDANKKKKKA